MKPQYRKEEVPLWRPRRHTWRYILRTSYWCRRIHTAQEQRRNCADSQDQELRDLGYHVRGRRRKLPTAWDDEGIKRWSGKSWKDFTRHRKQWMVGFDPEPWPLPAES